MCSIKHHVNHLIQVCRRDRLFILKIDFYNIFNINEYHNSMFQLLFRILYHRIGIIKNLETLC